MKRDWKEGSEKVLSEFQIVMIPQVTSVVTNCKVNIPEHRVEPTFLYLPEFLVISLTQVLYACTYCLAFHERRYNPSLYTSSSQPS